MSETFDGVHAVEPETPAAPAGPMLKESDIRSLLMASVKRARKNQHRLLCAARGGTHHGIHVESCDV